MRMELEHGDVVKALAVYLRSKGFVVEPDPANFVFKNESANPAVIDLLVVVKNMDTAPTPAPVPPPPAVPTPAPPPPAARMLPGVQGARQAAPAARPVAAPMPRRSPPKKNDMFTPVSPPQLIPPAPKHRILDRQAASSPALMLAGRDRGLPVPAATVPAFDGVEKGAEELIDEGPIDGGSDDSSPLLVDPSEMDPNARAIFEDILLRSSSRAEEGPHYATDSATDPLRPEGYLDEDNG